MFSLIGHVETYQSSNKVDKVYQVYTKYIQDISYVPKSTFWFPFLIMFSKLDYIIGNQLINTHVLPYGTCSDV